jgi:hypothetical protein
MRPDGWHPETHLGPEGIGDDTGPSGRNETEKGMTEPFYRNARGRRALDRNGTESPGRVHHLGSAPRMNGVGKNRTHKNGNREKTEEDSHRILTQNPCMAIR